MGIKVKLVKSHSGASERQVATIVGLGLKKFGSEKLLKDTPAIRGMINKVRHLVSHDQMVRRVHGDLYVVAHHASATTARGHGAGVGVGE